MIIEQEIYIDNEVRIRLLEKIVDKVDKRFDKIDTKMETQFYWLMGTMLTLFGGIILLIIGKAI
jgi:hypothetical protein